MIRVRIAPSPTGDPHVGTAYSALFNWAFARRHKGTFILRIEDTDQTRSTPESEAAIIEALRWLGLEWDEGPIVGGPNGPYRQSERSLIYQEHAKRLVDSGRAYLCFCTPERIAELRSRQRENKEMLGYDGLCRGLRAEEIADNQKAGKPFVVRLKVEKDQATCFQDFLRGEIRVENLNVDDQILIKADGFPTYHLANVVDDHLMGITHVIRAEEWVASTPKHVMLYQAFEWEPPVFLHLPLLRNKDHSKISKRKNPTSLFYYRDQGYLPEALLNFLALMGWSSPAGEEIYGMDHLIKEMDPKQIHLGGPVFDLDKLDWMNGMYIRELSTEALADRIERGFTGTRTIARPTLLKMIPLVRERLKKLSDFPGLTDYFFETFPVSLDDFQKTKLGAPIVADLLTESAALIDAMGRIDAPELEPKLRELGESMGVKAGQLFMALRVAITGRSVSPPLIESMEILGAEACSARLRDAAKGLSEG